MTIRTGYNRSVRKNRLTRVLHRYFVSALLFIIVMHASAQFQSGDSIVSRFDEYMQARLQEKIYLHSDKNFYLAGEICWFKLYDVDASFHRPLDMSKLAYVELLNDKNKPVQQAKIPLDQGFGNGSFLLTPDLLSGEYKLRSYTNWMKNFSAAYFFEKEITVVNPRYFTGKDSLRLKTAYKMNLFPEGGNLVNGIRSKIAFTVTDQYGKGISCTGFIIDDKQDTLLNFKTLKFGMGNFVLTPENGRTYEAVVVLPGAEKIIQKLPVAFQDGYVMHLEEADNNKLLIRVQSSGNRDHVAAVYLFAQTRGIVKMLLNGNTENGSVLFLVDKSKLGDGISQLTIFNSDRVPVCERLYFKYPEKRLDIKLRADNPEYSSREKIILHVNSSDETGKPLPTNCSMAVYQTDSLQEIDEMNIDNWLWLSSDLEGSVESPGYYLSKKGMETAEDVDNLMMTKGWRRFRWEDIEQNKKPVFEFLPENIGHIIKGKITDSATGYPAHGIAVYLSSPGTRLNFRTAVSDLKGMLRFDMKDFYTNGELILHTRNLNDSLLTIEIQDPFSNRYSDRAMTHFSQNIIPAGELMNHHVAQQVQNQYTGNRQNKFGVPVYDTLPFFGKPDYSYELDDYTRFTTMEEVLREYVQPVTLPIRNGKFEIRVLNTNKEQVFFDSPPLVLLNGVPVFDLNRIMRYDPFNVKKLEIVTRPWYYGDMAFSGIMNFVGYDNHMQGFELDTHSTVIDYEGLQRQREFYSPVYETPQQSESRLPDFRKLLYWSPDIKTNAKGEKEVTFYSSDLSGKYVVVLQGISKEGKTGTGVAEFVVREGLQNQ
jgi:hypothetical protein